MSELLDPMITAHGGLVAGTPCIDTRYISGVRRKSNG
jgi:hypothetical protein